MYFLPVIFDRRAMHDDFVSERLAPEALVEKTDFCLISGISPAKGFVKKAGLDELVCLQGK
jgi:hypothetical protein